MARSRPTTSEKLYVISNCCDNAYETLSDMEAKVSQMIAYKKKHASADGRADEIKWGKQISNYLVALENFATIDKKLEGSVKAVKQLCEEAHKLLGLEARPAVGLGAGAGATAEEEDKDERAGE